uniref:Uncharacterized protein n=1 Tax=Arundo donax TaxID=35708 RepID=A0A0A9BCD8_ARUDO
MGVSCLGVTAYPNLLSPITLNIRIAGKLINTVGRNTVKNFCS